MMAKMEHKGYAAKAVLPGGAMTVGVTRDEKNDRLYKLVETCWADGLEERRRQTRYTCPIPYNNGSPRQMSDPFPEFRAMVRGDQWRWFPTMPDYLPRTTKNILRPNTESFATNITNSRPRYGVFPREQNDVEKAEVYDAVLSKIAHDGDWELASYLAEKEALTCGVSWYRTEHDTDMPGDFDERVSTEIADDIVVAPGTTALSYMQEGTSWLVHRYTAQLGKLKQVKPKYMSWDDVDWEKARNDFTVRDYWTEDSAETENPARTVVVYEMWMMDPEKIEWVERAGELDWLVKGKKYPNGRRIVVSCGLVLEDEPNPYPHKQFPYTPNFIAPDADRFYPTSMVETLIPIQLMRNRMTQIVFEGAQKSVGNATIYNPDLLHSRITNNPNPVFKASDINEAIKFDRPGVIPRHYYDNMAQYDQDAKDVAMRQDISQGRHIPGNKTAAEVQYMWESDQTFVQLAARCHTWAIRRVAYQVLCNLGKWNDWETIVKVSEEVPGQGKKELRKPVKGKDYFKEDVEFDLVVDDTSTLPSSYQSKVQTAQLWQQMGVMLPPDILLEYLDAPESIIDKVKEAMEQEQEQPPPLPGAGGPGGPPTGGIPQGAPEMGQEAQVAPPEQQMQDLIAQAAMDLGMGDEEVAAFMDFVAAEGVPPEDAMDLLEGGGMPQT
jgi:hypothetical protein